MSHAQSNVGGRFVGRLRSSPWPVPGWFRAPALRSNPGPGGGVVFASARQPMPAPARAPVGFGGLPGWRRAGAPQSAGWERGAVNPANSLTGVL